MNAQDRLATALGERYRVERELGHGGMATVYLAHDLRHDRKVAIKVLHPELAHALGPERFLREITITAQFDHPYILPLLDSGVVEPGPAAGSRRLLYYVMPYVEGESLRDRMKRQKQLPLDDALQVTREVAEALGYAHARGVMHRDIKPENILLSGGHARVADFGIARAIDAAGSERLTETGLAVGTPAYMSPEQSMAERDIDGRSDLYALGCVLYEMLAGEPPYTGPTAQAIIAKRMTNPVPSVRTVRETVPAAVDRALTTVLARTPADRFATAAQFVEALGQPDSPAAAETGSRRVRFWPVAVGALLALALTGGWLFARARRPQVAPSASVIAVLPFLPSTSDTALARLGRDLVLTVSANLDGVGGIRAADPRLVLAEGDGSRGGRSTADALALGKKLGAGSVVIGDIVRVGPAVRLDLKLLSTSGDSQPLARASITSAPDSIGALTDSVTWALLRQVWRRGEPPSPSYASLTTRSVPALRAFLEGEQYVVAGRWPEAIDAFGRAIAADSTFWLAGWRYNQAQVWVHGGERDSVLKRKYESHLSALGERDRLLIELVRDENLYTQEEGFARLRDIERRFPGDWSVWWEYADQLAHWGPVVGYSNAEVRAALQRTVDLNPNLVPMWEHLFEAAVGRDSSQAARALKALNAAGHDYRYRRLMLAAGGQLPVPLRDSIAVDITRAPDYDYLAHVLPSLRLTFSGYPAAQIEFNRRLIDLAPRGPFTGHVWEGTAIAWAARGAWDSALVAYQRAASLSTSHVSPVSLYAISVSGAWIGGLDTARAIALRPAAARYLGRISPDSAATKAVWQAHMDWADGMLAVLRHDQHGLTQARARLQQSDASEARFMARALGGFALELAGRRQAAAESLAALDLAEVSRHLGIQHPYARSSAHLEASRLLLQEGDTTRAMKLLFWHEAAGGASWEPFRSQILAAPAYYELARIEETLGKNDLARDHYEQFLRRYDMPPPAHRHLVDEAKEALKRISGQKDVPASTTAPSSPRLTP